MIELSIEKTIFKRGKRTGKTRRFKAYALGFIQADPLWEAGQNATSERRPVYLALVGKESSLRPFIANLVQGARADMRGNKRRGWDVSNRKLKLMKRGGYQKFVKRVGELMMVTFFLPEVFRQEPGMVDLNRCQVLSVPSRWWVDDQTAKIASDHRMISRLVEHMTAVGAYEGTGQNLLGLPDGIKVPGNEIAEIAVLAAHYMAMLDKRTKRPLVDDLAFALQIYLAALAQEIASVPIEDRYSANRMWNGHAFADGFWIENSDDLGLAPGVMTDVPQGTLDTFLTRQVRLYQEVRK